MPPVVVIALVVFLIGRSTPADSTRLQLSIVPAPYSTPPLILLARSEEPPAEDPYIVDSTQPGSENAAAEEAVVDDEGHVKEVLDAEATPPEETVAAEIVQVPAPAAPPPASAPAPRLPTATPRPAPTSTPVPPPPAEAPLGGIEGQLLALHNAERARAGLPALQADATLAAAASRRARDMAARGYFGHTSPWGESISSILNLNAYSLLGENIARNTYPSGQTVSVAMSGFMQSASHRANVLSREFTRVGIGVSVSGNQTYYSVVYAAPR
jgi:uncharacterized protein YkwD